MEYNYFRFRGHSRGRAIKTEASFLSIAVVPRHFDKTFEGKREEEKRTVPVPKTVRETRN